ncbi:Magnetosome protein MamF [uncultured Gammaproteobacteria bacterium]
MALRSYFLAACSYLGVLCFVPLLFGRDDAFIHFHSRQGLVIWMWGVVALLLFPLPFGRLFFGVSSTAIMAFSAIGLISVLLGKTWKLPLVNDMAEIL